MLSCKRWKRHFPEPRLPWTPFSKDRQGNFSALADIWLKRNMKCSKAQEAGCPPYQTKHCQRRIRHLQLFRAVQSGQLQIIWRCRKSTGYLRSFHIHKSLPQRKPGSQLRQYHHHTHLFQNSQEIHPGIQRAPLKNTHSVSGLIFTTATALPKCSRSPATHRVRRHLAEAGMPSSHRTVRTGPYTAPHACVQFLSVSG